jgi:hypothetical protein
VRGLIARDAAGEGLRALAWPTLGACLLLVAFAPAAGGMALGARQRSTLDLVLWVQWVSVFGSALHLGTCLPGAPGLAATLLQGGGSRVGWVVERLGGLSLAVAVQVVLLGAAGSVVPAVRQVGPWIVGHLAGVWLEGVVLVAMAGLLRVLGARAWLAGLAAGALAFVGHLEAEVVQALSTWGLDPVGRLLVLMLPGFDQLQVQGALVSHQPVVVEAVLAGAVSAVGWCALLTGATVAVMARRDLV